nr:PREDICTED: uncharacterized protein LOC109037809 [Bemisia tabaci]
MKLAFLYSWAVLIFFCSSPTDKSCACLEIRVPVNYTALTGDLEVHLSDVPSEYTRLQLLKSIAHGWSLIGSIPLPVQTPTHINSSDVYQMVVVKFPCGVITQGGKYGVRLRIDEADHSTSNSVLPANEFRAQVPSFPTAQYPGDEHADSEDAEEIYEMEVRWLGASLTLHPQEIQTYPETPVTATLMFQTPQCEPVVDSLVPETWIDLLYCGHSTIGCTHTNSSHRQLLYSEQVRGYPQLREIKLECNLFGLAGHYVLALRTDMHFPSPIIASSRQDASLKAEWSEKFVFNVHARSIFPCDAHGGGVSVLFQYPSCILSTGDRVRVFARQRADVSAIVPPSVLEYVTEQKILKGKHSLLFDCELFTEKYVEYCFVYVSQALTGAVSDVRMDCVPTLPVSEGDSGQWGPWSEWTPCSTTCLGGTRNRYRFCDNPAPRFGAKFCEGHALETEQCGEGTGWECQLFVGQGFPAELPADRAEIRAEIGPACRCGCVIHLGVGKPRRLLASSSQSCPGRTFWLIQADRSNVVMLLLEHFRLTCPSQWLKFRDGDSLSSKLLTVLSGTPLHVDPIVSTGPFLLLEFFSDELVATGEECWGGFLAHAEQKDPRLTLVNTSIKVSIVPRLSSYLNELYISHLFVATLLAIVTTASLCLLTQYLRRYSKYQRAAAIEEMVTDLSEGDGKRGGSRVGEAVHSSTTTLLSEVMSLHRLPRANNHKRLVEDETEINDPPKADILKRSVPHQILDFASKSPLTSVQRKIQKPRSNMSINSSSKSCNIVKEGDISPASSSSQMDSKARKDRKNWERMMGGAGSELSLTGCDTDLEMDYYDYNVQNASTVPGSYLGMDPAFCVWIPPFAPGNWNDVNGDVNGDVELQTLRSDRPHSNTDSESTCCASENSGSKSEISSALASTPELKRLLCGKLQPPVQVHQAFIVKEKETRVEKSPSQRTMIGISAGDEEIKFVDDDDEELELAKGLIRNPGFVKFPGEANA